MYSPFTVAASGGGVAVGGSGVSVGMGGVGVVVGVPARELQAERINARIRLSFNRVRTEGENIAQIIN
jgi:hypothetical protein